MKTSATSATACCCAVQSRRASARRRWRNLKEEKSTSYTFGGTWTPTAATSVKIIHFGSQTLGTWSGPPVPNQVCKPKTSADLSFTWNFSEKTKFTFGGSNIFNVKPTTQDENETDNGFKYESVQFGLNGAAYFARLWHKF